GVGAGVRYIGKRAGDAADSFTLPSYTLVDLLAYWQLSKQARLTLNVHNLFDRDYYASSYSALWIAPGAGRTVRLGLRLSY
ncbi:TonB-dependent receptor, partial [Salmonella enterica subsp. enterica]